MPASHDDHSERLRNVEADVSEIKISSAVTTKSLEHIAEKITTGFAAVNDRLDKGAAQFEAHEARLDTQDKEIVKIQDVEKTRQSRLSVVKKAVLPLLAAAAGVVATKTGGMLWIWILSLLGISA